MRDKPSDYLERRRVARGLTRSAPEDGNNGQFIIWRGGKQLLVQASDGAGWEHVSVSVLNSKKTPSWDDMCFVKGLFWAPEECVIQYHPPESNYVNGQGELGSANCLHLWRPIAEEIPQPPPLLVGVRT